MRLLKLALLSLVSVCAASSAAWAGSQDFTLVNNTGLTIAEVYVSASKKDNWEEDVLGADTLPDGGSVNIHFAPTESAPMWDLMVKDEEGTAVYWKGLKLNAIRKVTLNYEDEQATATFE